MSRLKTSETLLRLQFLKEYWGVKSGGNGSNQYKQTGQNVQVAKTTADIAEAIGESEKTTRRLIKLNDLIPLLKSKYRVV